MSGVSDVEGWWLLVHAFAWKAEPRLVVALPRIRIHALLASTVHRSANVAELLIPAFGSHPALRHVAVAIDQKLTNGYRQRPFVNAIELHQGHMQAANAARILDVWRMQADDATALSHTDASHPTPDATTMHAANRLLGLLMNVDTYLAEAMKMEWVVVAANFMTSPSISSLLAAIVRRKDPMAQHIRDSHVTQARAWESHRPSDAAIDAYLRVNQVALWHEEKIREPATAWMEIFRTAVGGRRRTSSRDSKKFVDVSRIDPSLGNDVLRLLRDRDRDERHSVPGLEVLLAGIDDSMIRQNAARDPQPFLSYAVRVHNDSGPLSLDDLFSQYAVSILPNVFAELLAEHRDLSDRFCRVLRTLYQQGSTIAGHSVPEIITIAMRHPQPHFEFPDDLWMRSRFNPRASTYQRQRPHTDSVDVPPNDISEHMTSALILAIALDRGNHPLLVQSRYTSPTSLVGDACTQLIRETLHADPALGARFRTVFGRISLFTQALAEDRTFLVATPFDKEHEERRTSGGSTRSKKGNVSLLYDAYRALMELATKKEDLGVASDVLSLLIADRTFRRHLAHQLEWHATNTAEQWSSSRMVQQWVMSPSTDALVREHPHFADLPSRLEIVESHAPGSIELSQWMTIRNATLAQEGRLFMDSAFVTNTILAIVMTTSTQPSTPDSLARRLCVAVLENESSTLRDTAAALSVNTCYLNEVALPTLAAMAPSSKRAQHTLGIIELIAPRRNTSETASDNPRMLESVHYEQSALAAVNLLGDALRTSPALTGDFTDACHRFFKLPHPGLGIHEDLHRFLQAAGANLPDSISMPGYLGNMQTARFLAQALRFPGLIPIMRPLTEKLLFGSAVTTKDRAAMSDSLATMSSVMPNASEIHLSVAG